MTPRTPDRRLTDLPWQSRLVSHFPGDPERRNFTRQVRSVLYSEVAPTPVQSPRLLAWSDSLAADLGFAKPGPDDRESLDLLAGNRVLPAMRPYAARYGGHQFGQWADQLGDGRAITLGEVEFSQSDSSAHGTRSAGPFLGISPSARPSVELQLKGPGKTPYSRRADGRAVLRSSLREFLCSEAMHHLGVPTTRALSLVTTGEDVVRDMFYDGHPRPEPGAIVCRVAPSFLRFGNFEILAAHGETDLLKRLADFLIGDHYPDLDAEHPDVYGRLLDEIARRTAVMIAHWQRVGFVHGVMNTDNMSALGLTIDYGPYGWLEPYDPDWTPNTTDAGTRRYRFGAQPAVGFWNLTRLAEAFHPLIENEDRLYQSLEVYRDTFTSTYAQMMARKLGLAAMTSDADQQLVDEMSSLMHDTQADYTLFFRRLADYPAKSAPSADTFLGLVTPTFYAGAIKSDLIHHWRLWSDRYTRRLAGEEATDAERAATMKQATPKYVPRNYLAQLAINAAEQGDPSVLDRLMNTLQSPYADQPENDDLAAKRPDWATNTPGCSALSCSS